MADSSYKPYTGIGSRATPPAILTLMRAISSSLEDSGYTLRSGGADKADEAFESGLKHPDLKACTTREIYLPWRGFNGNPSRLWLQNLPLGVQRNAVRLAQEYHPAWHNCSPPVRKLHSRNVLQILGSDIQGPVLSEFVICWTHDGKFSGGTGQALRIAAHFGVTIFNLFNEMDRHLLYSRFDWSGTIIGDSLLQ